MKNVYLFLLFVLIALPAWAQPPYFDQGFTPTITANPPAPWEPCQVVQFSVTINQYNSFPGVSQWFHGLGISMGPCWTNITYGAGPPAYTNGQWVVNQNPLFSNNNQLGGCKGTPALPGFYFDGPSGWNGQQPQNNPGNNWGDGSGSGPWTFTWSAQVPCNPSQDPCLLTTGIQVYGDGETGNWGSIPAGTPTTQPCGAQALIQGVNNISSDTLYLGGFSVRNPNTNNTQTVFCTDSLAKIISLESNPQAFTYVWDFGDGQVQSGNGAGPYLVKWATPGQKTILRTRTQIDNGVIRKDSVIVTIHKIFDSSFNISDPTLCISQSTQISYQGDATVQDAANFVWDFGAGAVATPIQGYQNYSVQWGSPGQKNISLIINPNSPCPSTLTVKTVNVVADPVVSFSTSQDIACQGNPFVFTFSGSADPLFNFNWTFSNANPAFANTQGPHTIIWPNAGQNNVTLTVGHPDYCSATQMTTVDILPTNTSTFVSSRNAYCVNETAYFQYIGDAETFNNPTFHWNFGQDAFPGNAGGMGPHAVFWTTPGIKTVRLVLNLNTICPSPVTEMIISVNEKPLLDFEMQDSACVGKPVNIQYTGNPDPNFVYEWKFQQAVPATATGLGPHEPHWLAPGVKEVSLKIISPGCTRDTVQTIKINPVPIVTAGTPEKICRDSCLILKGNCTVAQGCEILWSTLDGSNGGIENPTALITKACPSVTTTYLLRAKCNECWSNVDTVTVYVSEPPIAAITQPIVEICSGTLGAVLQGSGSGGVGQLKYYWEPVAGLDNMFSPTPVANPTQTTTYTLVVVDSNGCKSLPVSAEVIVHPKPIADAGPDIYLCKGQGSFINANVIGAPGNYTYEWFPTVGLSCSDCPNPYCTIEQTTIYTLKVKVLETGCESNPIDSVSTVKVYVVQQATANAGPPIVKICKNERIQIGDIPVGGGPFYSYQWTPATGLYSNVSTQPDTLARPFAEPLTTTTYFLRVKSLGCESVVDSIVVFVKDEPTAAVVAPFVRACVGDSAQIQAVDPNVTADVIRYEWVPATGLSNPNIPNPKAAPLTNTTYTLHVYADDCPSSGIATATVDYYKVPQVDAYFPNTANQTIYCPGNEDEGVVLTSQVNGPDPYTFSWTPTESLNNPNIQSPTAKPTETTMYVLEVLQPAGNCRYYDSVLVIVPIRMELTLETDTNRICQGDTTLIRTIGIEGSAVSYVWTPTTGLACAKCKQTLAYPEQTTTYTVTGYEAGCEIKKQITVEVIPMPKPDFYISQTSTCRDSLVQFLNRTQNGVGYLWDFGDGNISNQTNPLHRYPQSGEYTVTLTAVSIGGACKSSVTLDQNIFVAEDVKAHFGTIPMYPDTLYMPNVSVQFVDSSQNAISWYWLFGDGQSSYEQNPAHTYQSPGVYMPQLIVTNKAGCSDAVKYGPIVIQEEKLEFPNIITPNSDGFNDVFRLLYTGTQPTEMEIYTRWGELVFTGTNEWAPLPGRDGEVPPGVYYYRVVVGKKVYTGSLTVLK